MVKVNIYTQTHCTVIQLCTHVSVSSFLSGITGYSLSVSRSHTHKQKQTGELKGAVAGAGTPTIINVTARVLFFFFFLVFYEAQSGYLAAKGNCG